MSRYAPLAAVLGFLALLLIAYVALAARWQPSAADDTPRAAPPTDPTPPPPPPTDSELVEARLRTLLPEGWRLRYCHEGPVVRSVLFFVDRPDGRYSVDVVVPRDGGPTAVVEGGGRSVTFSLAGGEVSPGPSDDWEQSAFRLVRRALELWAAAKLAAG
jgi:hypothetical protein